MAKTGVALSVKISDRAIDDVGRQLNGISNGLERALSGAINDTVSKGKTNIIKRMQAVLALKRGSIAEVVKTSKTSPARVPMVGKITISDAARPMYDYPHRKLKKGFSVRIRKGAPATKFPRAFEATVGKGHKGLFGRAKGRSKSGGQRVEHRLGNLKFFKYAALGSNLTKGREVGRGKGKKLVGAGYAGRLPIEELYGPGVTAVFTNSPGLAREELDKLTDYMLERLYSQTDRLLKRTKTRPGRASA